VARRDAERSFPVLCRRAAGIWADIRMDNGKSRIQTGEKLNIQTKKGPT